MRIHSSALRAIAGVALLGTLGGCIFTSPDIPAFLSNTSGSNQVVAPNSPAPKPLTVTVRDQNREPMENVTVKWWIKAGSGTLSAAETTTDGDGQTSVSYTAGASTGGTTIIAEAPQVGTAVVFVVVVQ
jgi:hypothetical protein